MGTDTITAEEAAYLDEQNSLDDESRRILADNQKRAEMLAEGYCEDCASGRNLFVGCYECAVHSCKRICMHRDCMGGPCLTEYEWHNSYGWGTK